MLTYTQPNTRIEPDLDKKPVRQPRHSVEGEVGHWVRTAGILSPLLIGELVKDPERKWRFIRVSSVAVALISEGLHVHRLNRERTHEDPSSVQL
jgi:hypothetical protein